MIVCRKCSRRHADGTEFCVCGAYLEFDGEHIVGPTQTSPVASPGPAASQHPAAFQNPSPTTPTSSVTTNTTTTPIVGPQTGTGSPPPLRGEPRAGAGAAAEPAPWSGLPGQSTWAPATSSGVDARLPDTPLHVDTAAPIYVDPSARPGELPCGQCRTPNPPERQFCRHCGAPLAAGVTATKLVQSNSSTSWWQRLVRSVRRRTGRVDPASLANTARRLSTGGPAARTVMFRSGALALVGIGLLSFLGPWKGTVMSATRRLLAGDRYVAISTDQFSGSGPLAVATSEGVVPAEFPQQGPDNVTDRRANTSWATRWISEAAPGSVTPPTDHSCIAAPATDTSLVFSFKQPTNIARIRILGGRYAGDPLPKEFSRPSLVELRIDDHCDYVKLASDGKLEVFTFSHRKVSVVSLRIVDIATDPVLSHTVEISEVVFDRRR